MRVRFVRSLPASVEPITAMDVPEMADARSVPASPLPLPSRARPRALPQAPNRKAWWPLILLLMLIVTGPVMYYVGESAYRSVVVDAPGFLRQRQVVAYVPPAHLEYAVTGQRATVTFPDGSQRVAEVVEVPDTKRLIPADPYDNEKIGVMVRMRFTEAAPRQQAQRLKDGLPVRVRFDPAGAAERAPTLGTHLQHAWNDARDQLKEWRSQPQR